MIQKWAIRTTNLADLQAHTKVLFLANCFLEVPDLYNYFLWIFMYHRFALYIPSYCMFTLNSVIHSYPTRQRDNFYLPPIETVFALKTIMYTGPSLWNGLKILKKKNVRISIVLLYFNNGLWAEKKYNTNQEIL